jgi:hypothetical protein
MERKVIKKEETPQVYADPAEVQDHTLLMSYEGLFTVLSQHSEMFAANRDCLLANPGPHAYCPTLLMKWACETQYAHCMN